MKKFENFCAALDNLAEIFAYEPPYDTVVLTGLVGLYEICFEQAWKAMKELLTYNGVAESQTGSPRQVLKAAYGAGLLQDEALWLQALETRNHVAHAYNAAVAQSIVADAKEKYYDMFCALREALKKGWQ